MIESTFKIEWESEGLSFDFVISNLAKVQTIISIDNIDEHAFDMDAFTEWLYVIFSELFNGTGVNVQEEIRFSTRVEVLFDGKADYEIGRAHV